MSNVEFIREAGNARRNGRAPEDARKYLEGSVLSLHLEELALALSRAMSAVENFEAAREIPHHNFSEGVDFYGEVRRFEIILIENALKLTGGSQIRAARLLRLKPTTLNAKIKAYNLDGRKSPGLTRI